MAQKLYVQERLCELREEAYCKVLKCFVAGQQYDLVRPFRAAYGLLSNSA